MFRLAGQPTKLQLPGLYFPRFRDYSSLVTHTRPGNLLGYWPLDESSGTVVHDLSGNGYHATAAGVLWQQPGIGDGRPSAYFDGATAYVNALNATMAARWNGRSGTVLAWAKVNSWAVDGYIATITSGAQYAYMHTGPTNGTVTYYVPAASVVGTNIGPRSDWVCFSQTWDLSTGIGKAYTAGLCFATTALATAWGTPNKCVFGAYSTVPGFPFLGWLEHLACWNAALTPEEIYNLGPQALAGVP